MELLFAFLASRPEYQKPKRCRRELVGPMLERLQQTSGVEILEKYVAVPERARRLIEERAVALDAIACFCDRCGKGCWEKP